MEIFVSDIYDFTPVTPPQLKRAIADVLHGPDFAHYHTLPLNFDIRFHDYERSDGSRTAILTVPSDEVGRRFLSEYGGYRPRGEIELDGYTLRFQEGRHPPRPELVRRLQKTPYIDPQAEEEQLQLAADLREHLVRVSIVQFGRRCRDDVYSVEYGLDCHECGRLGFDSDRRQFRLKLHEEERNLVIAFRTSQILSTYVGKDHHSGLPAIFFSFTYPPSYEEEEATSVSHDDDYDLFDLSPARFDGPSRSRLIAIDDEHKDYAAYASRAMRIICEDERALANFEWICQTVHIPIRQYSFHVAARGLFAPDVREEYSRWLPTWDFEIAFQLDAIARSNTLDLRELLSLNPLLTETLKQKGRAWTAAFVRYLHGEAGDRIWSGNHRVAAQPNALENLYKRCESSFVVPASPDTGEETFQCYHAKVTPSRVLLDGPFPERSNRVMRKYARYTSRFLRVTFLDENLLLFRYDREVDGHEFIQDRFGQILLHGLSIAGRRFEFLAYSQSGLKQHSVWFMQRFAIPGTAPNTRTVVTADSIISELGLFAHDPELMRCPARYGARIAQAFTTTEAAVEVEVDEVITIDDIMDEDGRRSFTDGVGLMSEELAQDIWKALQQKSVRHRRYGRHVPRAIQIRFQGYKGMLSVDPLLQGRVICLRPSMKKFEAPGSMTIEVAAVFNRPTRFYLNRYLIMLLEGLNVRGGYKIFKELQDAVIQATKDATESFRDAAKLCECYGLGNAFKLPSIFLDLAKLGVHDLKDAFMRRILNFGIYHILRDLKYGARIPVPGGYTLVGVADVHQCLKEGEILACVSQGVGEEPIYLEGLTMIARSPTVHPGDVQLVRAIGRPPKGSILEREPLMNTVVFSTLGLRPLASCLAGGDLDGDVFVCTTMKGLLPTITYIPADYDTAEKKVLERPSVRADVADFITEYLYSDNIGIIASTWLVLADQSELGILDPDCLRLAELHSDATDYPKSGLPVPMEDVPRYKLPRVKPDWNAPEVAENGRSGLYYESRRYIGRLYREVQLSDPQTTTERPAQRSVDELLDPGTTMQLLREHKFTSMDAIGTAVYKRVSEFLDPDHITSITIQQVQGICILFKDYVQTLRHITASYNIAHRRVVRLTEEEIVVGTIIAQSSQPRIRQSAVSEMREQASILVNRIAAQLASADEHDKEELLKRAWLAYRVSLLRLDVFGIRSFGLVAMHEIFDAIKSIETLRRFATAEGL